MGMDVFGRKPTSPEGEYFRRNVWGWNPLAQLCERAAPDIAMECEHWHSNDGDGLDASDAATLAERLQLLIADGSVAAYIKRRDAALAQLPDETCGCCDGTGMRRDATGNDRAKCRQCGGKGKQENFARHYHLDEDDVKEWLVFLRACGGFEIC